MNLYKITHKVSRENNYEKLLTMFNDTMQGKAQHLYIVMGGTPQFVEDTRRGLYSYEALATRLARGRFADETLINVSGPVIYLKRLDHSEIYLLLMRVVDVYTAHTSHDPQLSGEHLQAFMQKVIERLGADELMTPREVVRDFLLVLDLLRQNPETSFLQLIGDESFQPTADAAHPAEEADAFAEFDL